MKLTLRVLSLLAVAGSSSAFGAVLLSWNTTGNAGTETSEPSISNSAFLTSANLTLGAGVTAAGNGNRFGGTGWFDTGDTAVGSTLAESVSGNDYIQFIVTPTAGSQFTATSFDFIWDRSGTGPNSVTLRSSFDGFASDLGTLTGLTASTSTVRSIGISTLVDVTVPVTFRLYGYGGTATGGTAGFDTVASAPLANVILNGTASAVPEPSSFAALAGIGALGFCAMRRRRSA